MKWIARPVSLCVLLLALTGCGSGMEKSFQIQSDLTESLRLATLGQTVQARAWADRAIAVNPHALSTYFPTSSDPTDQDTLTIADVFGSVGDEVTLRSYMKRAASQFPQDYRPLEYVEEADETLGDTADLKATATALAALLEKKIAAPGTAHVIALTKVLAQAYCDAGNLAQGAAEYQKVIQARPKDLDGYNGLAYAYAVADSKPNLAQARLLAQKALTLAQRQTPNSSLTQEDVDLEVAECQDTLGWVQYRQGDFKDARANLEAVINSQPRLAESRYHLGMVYQALNQPAAALAEFQHAVQLEPGYADAQAALVALNKAAPPAVTTAQR